MFYVRSGFNTDTGTTDDLGHYFVVAHKPIEKEKLETFSYEDEDYNFHFKLIKPIKKDTENPSKYSFSIVDDLSIDHWVDQSLYKIEIVTSKILWLKKNDCRANGEVPDVFFAVDDFNAKFVKLGEIKGQIYGVEQASTDGRSAFVYLRELYKFDPAKETLNTDYEGKRFFMNKLLIKF